MALRAQLADEDIRAMLDRASRGEPMKAIAIDMGVNPALVARYLAHRPEVVEGKRRDKRAAIGVCLDAGCDRRETSAKSGASIAEVARFVWARAQEERVRNVRTPTEEELEAAQEAERQRVNAQARARYAARAEVRRAKHAARDAARAERRAQRATRDADIRAAYLSGEPLASIAARVGLSKQGVLHVCRDLPRRLPRKPKGQPS